MDRGAWGAIVHSVTKSQTRLKQLSMNTCTSQLLIAFTNSSIYTSLNKMKKVTQVSGEPHIKWVIIND